MRSEFVLEFHTSKCFANIALLPDFSGSPKEKSQANSATRPLKFNSSKQGLLSASPTSAIACTAPTPASVAAVRTSKSK